MVQTCPICSLVNSATAERCDCGYSFKLKHQESIPEKAPLVQSLLAYLGIVMLLLAGPGTSLVATRIAKDQIESRWATIRDVEINKTKRLCRGLAHQFVDATPAKVDEHCAELLAHFTSVERACEFAKEIGQEQHCDAYFSINKGRISALIGVGLCTLCPGLMALALMIRRRRSYSYSDNAGLWLIMKGVNGIIKAKNAASGAAVAFAVYQVWLSTWLGLLAGGFAAILIIAVDSAAVSWWTDDQLQLEVEIERNNT